MLVRIRFGRGPVHTHRRGKNSRIAQLAASVLTLFSISCFILAVWRVGMDLDFASNFIITSGLLSHWQVWMAAAALSQYTCWKLNSYARQAEGVPADSVFESLHLQDASGTVLGPSVATAAVKVSAANV